MAELVEEPGEGSVQLVAKPAPAPGPDLGRKRRELQADRLTQVDAEVLEWTRAVQAA
jgi:hypothetical protein